MVPEASRREPKGTKREPMGAQRSPNGSQKGTCNMPGRSQRQRATCQGAPRALAEATCNMPGGTKWLLWGALGGVREAPGGPRAQNRKTKSTKTHFLGGPNGRLLGAIFSLVRPFSIGHPVQNQCQKRCRKSPKIP